VRRPERNIEIFSMSVLDMFASALGAFIMCAIILFPYYNETKEFEKNIEKTKEAIRKSEQDLQAAKQRVKRDEETKLELQSQLRAAETSTAVLDQCRADATACRASLTKTFLLVAIEWAERCDVDLYVKDPGGNEYSYGAKTFPGSDAELSLDMRDGPGVEIWQSPVATPGEYEISFSPLSGPSGTATIKGAIVDRSGRHELPTQTMRCGSGKATIARVTVGPSGIVTRQLSVAN
jgi:hypothetical protein